MRHYVSTGEASVGDPLPDTLALAGAEDLRGVLQSSGMALIMSLNRARLPEGNAVDPIDPEAWANLADLAAAREIDLTVEAEGPLHYDYALWLDDNAECRRRIRLIRMGLSVWAARQPTVRRRVEHGTPALLTVPSDGPMPGYDDLLDYEADQLAGLVAGPTDTAYFADWNDLETWRGGRLFYKAKAAPRYPGPMRLILSPKRWTSEKYVGDDLMSEVTAYAAVNGCEVEWWGAFVKSQKPVPQFFKYFRRMAGR